MSDYRGLVPIAVYQGNAVDAVEILRFVARLPVIQAEPCPDIGGELP